MLCECTPAELGMALTLQTPEQDKNNTYMYILPHRIYMYVRLMRSTHLHDVTTLFRGGDRGAGWGGGGGGGGGGGIPLNCHCLIHSSIINIVYGG